MFRLLVVAGKTGLTASAVTEACSIAATSFPFHLKELTRAGLIGFERNGRHLIYHAAFNHMNALLGYLTAIRSAATTTCY